MEILTMEKRKYVKPAMKVFPLRHRNLLFQASANATMNGTFVEEDI